MNRLLWLVPAAIWLAVPAWVSYDAGFADGRHAAFCDDWARRYPYLLVANPAGCEEWVEKAKAHIEVRRLAECLDGR